MLKQWSQLDLAELPRWPRSAQLMLLLVVVVIVLALAYFFWLQPIADDQHSRWDTQQEQQANLGLLILRQQQARGVKPQVTEVVRGKAWSINQLVAYLSLVSQRQPEGGANLMEVQPLATGDVRNRNTQPMLQIQVQLEGHYVSVGNWLAAVLQEASIRVSRLEIQRSDTANSLATPAEPNALRVKLILQALLDKADDR